MYLFIKIYDYRTDRSRAMFATLFMRNNPTPFIPTLIVSFGTADIWGGVTNLLEVRMNATNFRGVGFGGPPCDAHGIPTYQLGLPTVEISNRCWWKSVGYTLI